MSTVQESLFTGDLLSQRVWVLRELIDDAVRTLCAPSTGLWQLDQATEEALLEHLRWAASELRTLPQEIDVPF